MIPIFARGTAPTAAELLRAAAEIARDEMHDEMAAASLELQAAIAERIEAERSADA